MTTTHRRPSTSSQARKQRKSQIHAPLHQKQKMMRAHLSKELRKKHGRRSLGLHVGDDVKVMSGQFAGTSTKVERISVKRTRVYCSKIEIVKREGNKTPYPLHPSNLLITAISGDEKKRTARATPGPSSAAQAQGSAKVVKSKQQNKTTQV